MYGLFARARRGLRWWRHGQGSGASMSTAGQDSFLNGSAGSYADEMFKAWRNDPTSVHKSWDVYFRTGDFSQPYAMANTFAAAASLPDASNEIAPQPKHGLDTVKVISLLRAYQVRGHFLANLDPLGISQHAIDRGLVSPDELDLNRFDLTEAALERDFDISAPGYKGFQDPERNRIKLSKLLERLKAVYTSTIGVEYMHINSTEQCNWLREKLETPEPVSYGKEERTRLLDRLTWADHFERFLSQKWATAKRFGVEGAESIIPGLKALIDRAAHGGVEDIVLGMPHRGRLNVLCNVVRKPLQQIFCEFSGGGDVSGFEGSGDVKYHLGMSFDRPVIGGGNIHLSLVANPSHLEAVNPVVCGKVRAKQFYEGGDQSRVMALLLHGDAAFAGQGIVYETMGLGELPAYTVGGTIHLIVNNQIGFTTDPASSRSSAYCSDLAKAFSAPIFHVNGDDPEAVMRVCELAAEWRQKFFKDVVIDVVCYRKYGHNELDEPMFTQPHMYRAIRAIKSPLELYLSKLQDVQPDVAEQGNTISANCMRILEESFEKSKKECVVATDWLSSNWDSMKTSREFAAHRTTGTSEKSMLTIGNALVNVDDHVIVHPRLKGILNQRKKMFDGEAGFDWGTAESLAFGSLLLEGVHVRLSGQDVERGTFSHRHAVLHDQEVYDKTYIPLEHLSPDQADFSVSNSSLSEFGVLGFELGFSLEDPNALVIWEAQFGDFANTAQVIFDQFLSSGEAKWLRQSGLVVLLPHGYEGQGPEHSSARLERFLQMSNDDESHFPEMQESLRVQIQKTNWQVLTPTTPANYFHALRRQIHRDFRKPLIVMSPKSLLRHKLATSTMDQMIGETKFQRMIIENDERVDENAVKRLAFCSGKVYYDLWQHREDNKQFQVALSRIEQISPFPFDLVQEEARRFPNAEIVWVQEEPRNMGAWSYVAPRIETSLKEHNGARPRYIGRPPSASTATGFSSIHKKEEADLIKDLFQN